MSGSPALYEGTDSGSYLYGSSSGGQVWGEFSSSQVLSFRLSESYLEVESSGYHSEPNVRQSQGLNIQDPQSVTLHNGIQSQGAATGVSQQLSQPAGSVVEESAARAAWYLDHSALEPKEYLGGYRHKVTGKVYHHACTCMCALTDTERYAWLWNDRSIVPLAGQTYNASTTKPDGTSAEATATQQAGSEVAEKDALVGPALQQMGDGTQPRSASDFKALRAEVEIWRAQEAKHLAERDLDPKQKQAAMLGLLERETRLLWTLDRLSDAAVKADREETPQKKLRALAAPEIWTLKSGATLQVYTPQVTRARELLHAYQSLSQPGVASVHRLAQLERLKESVATATGATAKSLSSLLNREADLLRRNRDAESMAGLRRRICGLLLQIIKELTASTA